MDCQTNSLWHFTGDLWTLRDTCSVFSLIVPHVTWAPPCPCLRHYAGVFRHLQPLENQYFTPGGSIGTASFTGTSRGIWPAFPLSHQWRWDQYDLQSRCETSNHILTLVARDQDQAVVAVSTQSCPQCCGAGVVLSHALWCQRGRVCGERQSVMHKTFMSSAHSINTTMRKTVGWPLGSEVRWLYQVSQKARSVLELSPLCGFPASQLTDWSTYLILDHMGVCVLH